MHRRDVLKAGAPLLTVGVAGCSGGGGDGDGGDGGGADGGDGSDGDMTTTTTTTQEEQFWPPENNQVEAVVTVGTGSTRFVLPNTWKPYKNAVYPDGAAERIVNRPGGGGLVAQNTVANDDKDGGTYLSGAASILIFNSFREEAQFDISDFVPFQDIRALSQAVQVSSNEVDSHFSISWDEFINRLKEEEWNVGSASPETAAIWRYIFDNQPDISPDQANVINFQGGAELRAALARGEVHVNFGPTTTNYQRTESYYTQFVALDDRYSGMKELVEGVIEEDPTYFNETSFPSGPAETVVDLTTNTHTNFLHKDVPQETVEVHEQVCRDAVNDDLVADVNGVLGEGLFYNVVGDEARATFESSFQTIQENRDILGI